MSSSSASSGGTELQERLTAAEQANRELSWNLDSKADELRDITGRNQFLSTEVAKWEILWNSLLNEIDCRIEHGAESGGHLEYVRDRMRGA